MFVELLRGYRLSVWTYQEIDWRWQESGQTSGLLRSLLHLIAQGIGTETQRLIQPARAFHLVRLVKGAHLSIQCASQLRAGLAFRGYIEIGRRRQGQRRLTDPAIPDEIQSALSLIR
jgi:hypothetical protein